MPLDLAKICAPPPPANFWDERVKVWTKSDLALNTGSLTVLPQASYLISPKPQFLHLQDRTKNTLLMRRLSRNEHKGLRTELWYYDGLMVSCGRTNGRERPFTTGKVFDNLTYPFNFCFSLWLSLTHILV